jgi:hypothetical protein
MADSSFALSRMKEHAWNEPRRWIALCQEAAIDPACREKHHGESSAHLPNTEEKDKLNEFMIHTVLPALAEWTGTAHDPVGTNQPQAVAMTTPHEAAVRSR